MASGTSGRRSPRLFDWLDERETLAPEALRARYADRIAKASTVEAAGDARHALRLVQEIGDDFNELVDVSEAADQARRLSSNGAVRRIVRDEERLADDIQDYKALVVDVIAALTESRMSSERAARRLDLEDLLREAEDTERPLYADAAGRKLETAFVNFAFYGPHRLLRRDATRWQTNS